jgi:predicted secreted hydrolase
MSAGTLVAADGSSRRVDYADFDTGALGTWTSPRTGGQYPSGWIVRLPREQLELTLTPTLADQELVAASMGGVAYWEGSVRVRGTSGGRPVSGEGYVELTGYAGRSPF